MRRQPSPTALIFSDDKPQISGTFTQIGAASRRALCRRAARETPPAAGWSRPIWGYCAALLSARPAAVMSFPIPSIVLQAPRAPAKPRIRTAAMIRRSMGIQPSILTDRRASLLGLVGDCPSRSNRSGRFSCRILAAREKTAGPSHRLRSRRYQDGTARAYLRADLLTWTHGCVGSGEHALARLDDMALRGLVVDAAAHRIHEEGHEDHDHRDQHQQRQNGAQRRRDRAQQRQ